MEIKWVHCKNFRNFTDEKIYFEKKTLVIGPNDSGKSNLLYGIRLLLDRNLNQNEIEPLDTDFNVETKEDIFEITIKFVNANLDCIMSIFKENISEDGSLYLRYRAEKKVGGSKMYSLFTGESEETLKKIESRHYLKFLNFEYLRSNRDLSSFFRKEKRRLFELIKEDRNEKLIDEDNRIIKKIENNLTEVNSEISKLSYVKNSLEGINSEISNLSNMSLKYSFDSGAINPDEYINRVQLVAESNGDKVILGGDGASNQLFITMWCPNKEVNSDMDGLTIYGIEEPEAHLHPHNQRTLASYLVDRIDSQVLITSHSPQIACEFSPNFIVKLYRESALSSKAASGGCSQVISDAIFEFGYRLNIVPAETFFSSCVLLVEGPSEVMFYKALAASNKVDLDKLNISILSVNGIGFQPYVRILNGLRIPFVLRTDNDIKYDLKNKNEFLLTGLKRAFSVGKKINSKEFTNDDLSLIEKKYTNETLGKCQDAIDVLVEKLKKVRVLLARHDLELDMISSPLLNELCKFYETNDKKLLHKNMCKSKGVNMYKFIMSQPKSFMKLHNHQLFNPIRMCAEIVK